jgi:hypothetical protein
MTIHVQRINLGNAYAELPMPEGSELGTSPQHLLAHQPDEPEPLEEQPYIFRPNDPFRSYIDEARATGSISAAHKPWVRKAWFAIFVAGPVLYALALAFIVSLHEGSGAQVYLSVALPLTPFWVIYVAIWWRKLRPAKLRA